MKVIYQSNCGNVQFDIKNHKMFLRRVAYPAISLEQLFIGSTILVYTRQLLIEDYGDDFTRKHLQGLQETYVPVPL
jgi:nucleoside-diphosphate kinase